MNTLTPCSFLSKLRKKDAKSIFELLDLVIKRKISSINDLKKRGKNSLDWSGEEIINAFLQALKLDLIDYFSYKKFGLIQLTQRGYYLLKLRDNLENSDLCRYIFAEPGVILLKDEKLFYHPLIKIYHDYILQVWQPIPLPIALYLPCSKHKPYSKSFMQLKIRRMLYKWGLIDYVQIYIVSEPLVLVPYQLEKLFPAAHYDYPPERVSNDEIEIYIKVLREILKKLRQAHKVHIYSLPRFHKAIFENAASSDGDYIYVPYNVYYIPRLARTLSSFKEKYSQ